MEGPRVYTLGTLLDHIYADSLAYWRRKYAASTSLDDLLGGPLDSLKIEVSFQSAGRLELIVTALARRRHESEVYFFRAQRQGPNDWIVTGSSFDLD